MSHRNYRRILEEKKASSVLQLLFKTARLANEWAIAQANFGKTDGPVIRAAHTSVLPHLDLEGTRVTTLAGRMGVSKQAVAQLIDDLEKMGVVERVPDPSDGRAKLVRFTELGRKNLLDGLQLLSNLESELGDVLGTGALENLHGTLTKLLAYLEGHQLAPTSVNKRS